MDQEETRVNEPALDLLRKEQELAEKEAALQAKEAQLGEQEKVVQKRMRDNLYAKIPVSVHTMDKVIAVLVAALVILLAVGIYLGAR